MRWLLILIEGLNDLGTTRNEVNVPYKQTTVPRICRTSVPHSKFQSGLLYDQPFLRYMRFCDKCNKGHQSDIEHYKVEYTHVCVTSVPESQMAFRFALQLDVFEL